MAGKRMIVHEGVAERLVLGDDEAGDPEKASRLDGATRTIGSKQIVKLIARHIIERKVGADELIVGIGRQPDFLGGARPECGHANHPLE